MKATYLLAAAMGAILAFTSIANAATLIVEAGELKGATDVNVLGTLYDVEFLDGTCAGVFSGCDSASDFIFMDSGSATAASQALLDQVFLDGAAGSFDSQPALTAGCSDLGSCWAWTPYAVSGGTASAQLAINWFEPSGDIVGTGFASADFFSFTSMPQWVWAKYSVSAAPPVPEPSTWAMMLLGFGFVGGAMRSAKRRRAVAVSYAWPGSERSVFHGF